MKQVFISNKGLSLQDVPAPLIETGQILVRLHYSCISTGTEMSGVSVSDTPLWKRAAENPQKVKQVIDNTINQGAIKTFEKIKSKLDELHPLGYSAAGEVIKVGSDIKDIKIPKYRFLFFIYKQQL